MSALIDIMGWRNISTAVTKVEPGIPDPLPKEMSSLTEPVLGDQTTVITFHGQRSVARRVEYGAPSRNRVQQPIGSQDIRLFHFNEHIKLQHELIMRLRNPNDLLAQEKAQEVIARAGADFRQVFENTRIVSRISAVANGKIWFDANGFVLPTSSGAFVTLDYQIPSSNTGQLTYNGTPLIDTTWTNAAAQINQQIEKVRIQMRINTGRELEFAYYGKNIPGYLFNNTTTKAFWQFNPALYNQFQSNPGIIPDGTLGVKRWIRMGDTFFDDQNGVTQTLFPADRVTFGPRLDRNSYTLYEGTLPVPKSFGVAPDAMGALADFENVTGMGGYAIPELDPIGIKVIMFDTQSPWLKNPLDWFYADVAF